MPYWPVVKGGIILYSLFGSRLVGRDIVFDHFDGQLLKHQQLGLCAVVNDEGVKKKDMLCQPHISRETGGKKEK